MRRWIIIVALLTLTLVVAAQEGQPKQVMRFGVRTAPEQWASLQQVLAAEPCRPDNPLGVTLVLPAAWSRSPDWPAFDATAAAVRGAGARLVVSSGVPADAADPSSSAYLAALSEHAGGKADTLVLSLDRPQLSSVLKADPDRVALTLKQLTAALRGRSEAKVLLGEVASEDLADMEPLYERDFRAYVEGYSSFSTGPTGEPDDDVVRFIEAHHLGAPLLLHLPRLEAPIAAQLLVLLSATRGVTFVDVEPANLSTTWHALLALRAHLTPQMGPGFSVEATEVRGASGPRPDVGMLNFLDPDQMVQAMVLVPNVANSLPETIEVHLPTGDVSSPALWSLTDGTASVPGYTVDQKKQESILRVPWQGKALLLSFNRLKTGTVGEERVTVTGTYRIPVEVILARHQAVQQPQDVFLENYRADAQVDYHFKIPGGGSGFDVTFLNTFYFEKGVGARWVQNQMLLNGVAWKGGTIPNLPIIEPDKVNTVPLALTLGRDYVYKYLRDEAVDGRDCYVVEFIPAPGAKGSLYSGKVWIDKATYVKVRMTVRQTGLQPPQVSNDETDTFSPVQGPDGRTYTLITRVVGQQIFLVAGANIAADRTIRFTNGAVDDPSFRAEVQKDEAGNKPILQETEKGLRYLEKQKDGTRKLRMDPVTGKWFAVAGTYYDKSLDYPLPLIGVNYFDYDFKKTKTQVNMLLAGAVNTFTVAKMDLMPRVDADANAALFAIPFADKVYPAGTEAEDQRVKVLREYANGSLGWRVTEFSKLSLELGAMYYRYSRDSKTSDLFTLPKDHFDLAADLGFRYSRRGWSLAADYDAHHRSAWEPWGLPGAHADADQKRSYALWNVSGAKSFYLPYFQKISVSATWMDGNDLDRFSKYQFSYLGRDSLSGFAGSGVRFDRGAVARLSYDFSLAKVVRFGLALDQARVQPDKGVDLWQNHTGVGFSGAITGPWQTYWTLDVGYALRSDIPQVQHDYTVALLVLKLW